MLQCIRFWGMKPAILLLCALIVVALPACAAVKTDGCAGPSPPQTMAEEPTHDARPDT